MLDEERRDNSPTIWRSAAVALALHVIAGILLVLRPAERQRITRTDDSITVEILQSLPTAAKTKPSAEKSKPIVSAQPAHPVDKEAHRPQATPLNTPSEPANLVRAKQLFSTKILADPRSKQARDSLSQLATDERIVQLCNVEAMEQVHRWKAAYQPDMLVAYAMADTKLSGRTLRADGGAFRSTNRWYNVKFKCEVSPDIATVVAFEFSVGEEIPRSDWEAHFLAAGDGASD